MSWNKSDSTKRKKASEYTEKELLDEIIRSRGGAVKVRYPWSKPPREGPEGIEDRRVPFPYEESKGPVKPVRDHELTMLEQRLDKINTAIDEIRSGGNTWESQRELERLEALRENLHERMGDLREDAAEYEKEAEERRVLEESESEAETRRDDANQRAYEDLVNQEENSSFEPPDDGRDDGGSEPTPFDINTFPILWH